MRTNPRLAKLAEIRQMRQPLWMNRLSVRSWRATTVTASLLSMVLGAAVVALVTLTITHPELQPDLIHGVVPHLRQVNVALLAVGGMVVVGSLVTCLSVSTDSGWLMVTCFILCVLSIAADVGCGVLTLFLKSETKDWIMDNHECRECQQAARRAFHYPLPAAIILLVDILLQVLMVLGLYRILKGSPTRHGPRHEILIPQYSPRSVREAPYTLPEPRERIPSSPVEINNNEDNEKPSPRSRETSPRSRQEQDKELLVKDKTGKSKNRHAHARHDKTDPKRAGDAVLKKLKSPSRTTVKALAWPSQAEEAVAGLHRAEVHLHASRRRPSPAQLAAMPPDAGMIAQPV